MLTPDIKYTYSLPLQARAREVLKNQSGGLQRMKKEELIQVAVDLGAGTAVQGIVTKGEVLDALLQRALLIKETSAAETHAAYSDPAYKRAAFFDHAWGVRRSAQEQYAKAHAAAADYLEFQWSKASTLIEAAAKLRTTDLVLRYEEIQDMDLDAVRAELTKDLLRRVSFGTSRSTNQVANLQEEAEASALAELLNTTWY